MVDFFWRKQRGIENDISDYLKEAEICLTTFRSAIKMYLSEGSSEAFKEAVEETHIHESKADDKRREIERTLYDQALIPELRGDVLGMLESIDTVPNQCETVLYKFLLEGVSVPEEYHRQIEELVDINVDAGRILCEAVRDLFRNPTGILDAGSAVDAKESKSDRIERDIIRAVFASQIEKVDKILLRDVVFQIGSISDRAENAADRLTIVAIKHRT